MSKKKNKTTDVRLIAEGNKHAGAVKSRRLVRWKMIYSIEI